VAKKKVIFSFPPTLIEEPVTYKLVKSYDLQVNILRARVVPRDKGRMVVELKGTPENLEEAFDYLENQGVQIDTMIQEMRHHTDRCVHCTACTAICPTGALSVDQETREVSFDASLCIICEACIPVCSFDAIESLF
jgi:ferredoxin